MRKLVVMGIVACMCFAGSTAQAWYDNMEYATQADASAVWGADALNPSATALQLTSAVNHTAGGGKALASQYGVAYSQSSHSFTATNGYAEVWFYDPGVKDMSIWQTSFIDFRSADYGSYNVLGTNRETGVSEDNYFFYTNVDGWATVFQGPERSQGWHLAKMTFSDTGGTLSLDGMNLKTNSSMKDLGFIRMGNGHWDGDAPGFAYDDVTVTPEPCTMAILGIGSLLMLKRRK